MKAKIFAIAVLLFTMTSCFNPGITNFTATDNGVEYNYEVIVPLMNFVRIAPVTPAEQLTGEVTLPSTVEYDGTNFVITQIAENAFEGYTGITEMTIPATISTIEEEAFKGCTSLRAINTPQPLSVIEKYAFEDCAALEEFSLEASISTLGEGCFRNCTALTEVIFPTSLNSISAKAYEGCTGIETLFIDRTMLSIGSRAFAGCSGVTTFTCLTATPPTAASNTFEGMDADLEISVPTANVDQYRNATGWNYFSNYVGTNQ